MDFKKAFTFMFLDKQLPKNCAIFILIAVLSFGISNVFGYFSAKIIKSMWGAILLTYIISVPIGIVLQSWMYGYWIQAV